MHIHFLDPYIERNSLVHRLDPRIKFILVIAFILTTAVTKNGNWPVFILLTTAIFSCELLSELSIPFYLKRALLAIPFVLAALPIVLTSTGQPVATLPFGLTLTSGGVIRFFSIALKSWISIQAAILLSSTTPFPDILLAMRFVRFPKLLVAIVGLMWRYLFVMADEALRLIRARQSRSGTSPNPAYRAGGSLTWRAKTTGGMAGSLFLRSLERSDRIYMAMVARGYDGDIRTLPPPDISRRNWLMLFLGVVLLALITLFGMLI